MEHNGIFSGIGSASAMLGLEMPLHQPQNPQNQPNQHHMHHPQIVGYAHNNHDQSDHNLQPQQSLKNGYNPFASTVAKPQSPLSDEDEPNGDENTSDGKKKMSPWQRMKWTDHMVRLLIMAVFYIGDEVGSEGNGNDFNGKKKSGIAQKKGKWKSVSKAMLEKGFYVSPQQCEDKFNDLNKRYKRVNDILGKGMSCKVVENQNLLETMELSSKMKEEVKKLLNSKHLFFREMCAYHNSCGHGSNGGASASHSAEVATDQSRPQHQLQQRCSHSTANPQFATNSRTETEGSKMARRARNEEEDEEDYDDSDEDEDDYEDEDDEGNEDDPARKRQKTVAPLSASSSPSLVHQLNSDLVSVVQDESKSALEKKHWMRVRLMQIEEQRVSYQHKAFELEKQRLKWVKFSSKKEREMERAKLENERTRLESERMVLLIRQKEVELLELHQHSNKRSDPSSITG
ncbi:trihelix transcription factor DF1 [Mercurialis annua]|uniref:trihelix transcription factor DF1 n=1 Tax=Mercurialis annua TaxID=3986 RepID=UPI00215E437E|nr:trihelix transcription factor DF1 [Mercurialis annua]XP_050226453.1 trihelix transcription factor DF1 [Mercurialis annua]XP_050226454.1 trihelix transcription factor DF1 [Mercurialis annua]